MLKVATPLGNKGGLDVGVGTDLDLNGGKVGGATSYWLSMAKRRTNPRTARGKIGIAQVSRVKHCCRFGVN